MCLQCIVGNTQGLFKKDHTIGRIKNEHILLEQILCVPSFCYVIKITLDVLHTTAQLEKKTSRVLRKVLVQK